MIYLTGDTHGYKGIIDRLQDLKYVVSADQEATLIVLGDFGLLWNKNFREEQVKGVESFMREHLPNLTLAFLDGNHENFHLLNELPIVEKWGNFVGQVGERIFRLLTGRVYWIEHKTFAVYGGAFSIDKAFRTKDLTWWAEEITKEEKIEELLQALAPFAFKVDYLLTHTCDENSMFAIDKPPFTGKLEDPVAKQIRTIKESIEIREFHAFGHMHVDRVLVRSHKVLAMFSEFYELKE